MKTSSSSSSSSPFLIIPAVIWGLSGLAQADITIHGSTTAYQETGGDWLTMGTNDIDSNGGLGTDGWFFFGDFDGRQENNKLFTQNISNLPSYVTNVTSVTDFLSVADEIPNYGAIDSPILLDGTNFGGGAGVSRAGTGLPAGTFNNTLEITIGTLAVGQSVRIGVLSGTEGTEDGRWDPTSITLDDGTVSATVGNHDSNPLPPSPGGTNTAEGNTGWVFFDIDTAGTYTLGGTKRLAGNQGVSFGGLTFDSIGGSVINDPDNDGLSTIDENNLYETDPNNPDTDGDGQSDGDEVLFAGTDPLNAGSVLRITSILYSGGENTLLELTWSSVPGRSYTIQSSFDLQIWTDISSTSAAESPATTTTLVADVPAVGELKKFYRVLVTPSL